MRSFLVNTYVGLMLLSLFGGAILLIGAEAYSALVSVPFALLGLLAVFFGNNYLSDIKHYKFRELRYEKKIYFGYILGVLAVLLFGVATSTTGFLIAIGYALPSIIFVSYFVLKCGRVKNA
ncbi:hypothetical protein [Arsukibacterium ikkense]|uniref:hypothetical protein n=1 Tax=Arsukibacterium ikkense TaxID=336831 RepID=UPI00128B767F|nr:hypothetical protein [Arsukibacterium ikkense]